MSEITLVIPAKNESESLPKVLDELKRYKVKKLIVMSKSDTETFDSIKDYNEEIIFQSRRGFGNALVEGIKKALQMTTPNVIALQYANKNLDKDNIISTFMNHLKN